MIHTFIGKGFGQEYAPTTFDNYSANYLWEERTIDMGLWDTAGVPDFAILRPLSYTGSDVFIICFDVTNESSFDNVAKYWLPEKEANLSDCPWILVGCKCDLLDNQEVLETTSTIPYPYAARMAQKLGAVACLYCSARSAEGIDVVMTTAIQAALLGKNPTMLANRSVSMGNLSCSVM